LDSKGKNKKGPYYNRQAFYTAVDSEAPLLNFKTNLEELKNNKAGEDKSLRNSQIVEVK
jgi:hypothetical protein